MYLWDRLLVRGRLPISSFICFIGGFSMGSWLTLFHQLQLEKDVSVSDYSVHTPSALNLLNILIISAPSNFDRRNTLRTTWLKLNPNTSKVKHFFVLGTAELNQELLQRLKREQIVEGDLLFLPDLLDSYNNLTLKLLHGIEAMNYTKPFKYMLKCDDDSFVRVNSLVDELVRRQSMMRGLGKEEEGCFYWGFFDGRARVQKKGKWKESDYNLCDLYIPYALGGGYVLSKKCTDYIIKNHEMLRPFRNEDVSVGTWLAPIVHEKKHDVRFDTEFESRGCNNGYLVQHKISQADMVERYKNLVTQGTLCRKESRHRPSYNYQFDVPPSNCCHRDASDPALI